MKNMPMKSLVIPFAAAAALMLAGCTESPSETAKDVSEARQEAAEDSNEARDDRSEEVSKANEDVAEAKHDVMHGDDGEIKKLTAAEAEAMSEKAKADFDVATTDAEGRLNIATEKCDALSGVDKDACVSTANATFAADKAAATATRDAALVRAEHHD